MAVTVVALHIIVIHFEYNCYEKKHNKCIYVFECKQVLMLQEFEVNVAISLRSMSASVTTLYNSSSWDHSLHHNSHILCSMFSIPG